MTHDPRRATSPAWSPDGTAITYTGYVGGDGPNLFVVDVASRKSSQLTNGSLQCPLCTVDPQFTPDGSSIIYTGCPASSPVARTVPVTGGKSTIMLGPGKGPGGLDGWYVSAAGAWCSRSSGGYEQV